MNTRTSIVGRWLGQAKALYLNAVPPRMRRRLDTAVHKGVLAPALYACGSRVSTPGYTMFLDPRDAKGTGTFLNFHLHGHVVTEPFELTLFLDAHRQSPGALVIDVGANYGLYTLESCLTLGAIRRIAIEADHRVFSFLKRSICRGGFDSAVVLVNAAVCAEHDSNCRLMAHRDMSSFNMTCRAGDESNFPEAYRPTHSVRGVTVDGILADLDIPLQSRFLVKLDIEGGEPLAFAGMRRMLAESAACVVFFEVAPGFLSTRGVDLRAYASTVFACNPDGVFEIDERRRELHPIADPNAFLGMVNRVGPKSATNVLLVRNAPIPSPAGT